MLRNERGSVLSVAVIMIALLSFALTSVTAYSYRTAENTNRIVNDNESTNQAKRLVSEGMVRFEQEVNELVETSAEDEAIISEEYETEFNDTMDPVIETIEADLGIRIMEAEDKIDGALIDLDVGAKVFRFSYPLNEDREMVKYLFLSNYGTKWEAYDAFEYSIGSSANVVINGGGYNNSTDIYGHSLYNGYSTAYKTSPDSGYSVFEAGVYNYPSGDDLTFTSPNYHYCDSEAGLSTPCLGTDGDGNLIIRESQYTEFDEGDSNYFSDLLIGFDYDRTFYSNLEDHLGTEDLIDESNYEAKLDEYINDGTLTELSDSESETYTLTDDNNPLPADSIIRQDTTINMGDNRFDLADNTLIILGDLDIKSVRAIDAPGQVYVFGDIYIENDRDLLTNANYFATGDIHVTFPSGTGFEVYGNNKDNEGTALFAGGNIEINRTHTPPLSNGVRFHLFMVAQDSIKIDAAVEEFSLGGAIYAQGKGDGLDDVDMDRDGTTEPFNGILINSFNGDDIETDNPSPGSYNEVQGNNNTDTGKPGVNPGGRPKKNDKGKIHDDTEHLFRFSTLTSPGASRKAQLEVFFNDLPDFKQLEIEPTEGEILTDTSTFLYEPYRPPEE